MFKFKCGDIVKVRGLENPGKIVGVNHSKYYLVLWDDPPLQDMDWLAYSIKSSEITKV